MFKNKSERISKRKKKWGIEDRRVWGGGEHQKVREGEGGGTKRKREGGEEEVGERKCKHERRRARVI